MGSLTNGRIPSVDHKQTELFLREFKGFRVMPWIGGVLNKQVFPNDPKWRRNFLDSILDLLQTHPKFQGIHINIEPWPSGNQSLLTLLKEIRKALPQDKVLSVAAFLPPTFWQPFKETHWDAAYFREIAKNVDQMVVMMYDTSFKYKKFYQQLMKSWTREILDWSKGAIVLLGVPSYKDEDVGYHNPGVENLSDALSGIHAGLNRYREIPSNYQGISLYCEWEMDELEWQYLRKHFLKP
ncbi:MAG TPA: glycosyl hydrolase family 18 protein [Candidatus Wunengus sp. YC60]|uniref:glycosyl hydrolase family 18 protein n=1 Tax=Candidatus Wunengus sp. YC60 TaxID=3367697 RepID=UPI0040289B16